MHRSPPPPPRIPTDPALVNRDSTQNLTNTEPNNENSSAHTNKEEPGLFRVGVRIPAFWPENPAVWFAQVEGQFVLSKVTCDSTKYYYVIAQLDHRIANEVQDIIINPPATGKYEKLKCELIKRLSASQEKRIKQLLEDEVLGDRKPSQFLRHLQQSAGASVPEHFLRTLWANRLPRHIQTVIATQMEIPLDKVAELADKVHDIVTSGPSVAMTSAAPAKDETMVEMCRQICELTKQVAALTTQVNSRSRSNDRSDYRSRNRSRQRSNSRPRNNSYCFYHNRFGDKAHKCTTPCSYAQDAGNSTGSRK